MYDLFLEKINEKVNLTGDEREKIKSYLSSKKLRKNQYFLQEGDDAKYVAFVEKGALRQYSVDDEGGVHIVQFAIEGWTISDLYSFLTGEKSGYNIDAIEDADLVLIDRHANEEMLATIPKYETYTRLQITGAYIAMQKRLNAITTLTLEERYKEFTKAYPNIHDRFPQHMIASYLGLQPATLSRIRRRISGQ
jgi:CRP-like cAMP-binding protein